MKNESEKRGFTREKRERIEEITKIFKRDRKLGFLSPSKLLFELADLISNEDENEK